MPRFTACLGACALSALLSSSALASTPDPQSSSATLSQSLDAGIRDAQTKRAHRDYAGAIRTLSQLMLVAPDDARVVGEYGKVLVQQGRAREALDFLNRAVQLQQGDWMLYSALGVAYDQAGDYINARLAYEQALSLKPGEVAVLNNYAMSRALAGDLTQAKKLIADASAGSKDERVARNVKMINSLTPAIAAAPPPVAVKPVPAAPKAMAATPHTLVQPLPAMSPPTAAKTIVPAKPKTAVAAPVKKPVVASGIPALRLANDRP